MYAIRSVAENHTPLAKVVPLLGRTKMHGDVSFGAILGSFCETMEIRFYLAWFPFNESIDMSIGKKLTRSVVMISNGNWEPKG